MSFQNYSREKCEQLYDILNRKHFIEGGILNSLTLLLDSAEEVGIDRDTCEAFLASDCGVSEVSTAVDIIHRLGINSIPTLIIDGKVIVSGAQNSQHITEILNRVIEEKICASAEKRSEPRYIFQDILTLNKY